MSDDLVRRLRERTDYSTMLACDPPRPAPDRLCHDAADQIERLQNLVSAQAQDIVTLGQLAGRGAELEARIAALEEALEPFAVSDLTWTNQPDWLDDDTPVCSCVLLKDIHRAHAALAKRK